MKKMIDITNDFKASKQNSSALPSIFEAYGAFRTMMNYGFVEVHMANNLSSDKDAFEYRIDQKFNELLDIVVPYNHKTRVHAHDHMPPEENDDFLEKMKERYSDFPALVKAIQIMQSIEGKEEWDQKVFAKSTMGDREKQREKFNLYFFGSKRNMNVIALPHSGYRNTTQDKDVRTWIEDRANSYAQGQDIAHLYVLDP